MGTAYCGWQKQPNQKTIQGEIENAIKVSMGLDCEVFASGRTDAGVHALGQTAHFDVPDSVPTSKIPEILNCVLNDDIVIKSARDVSQDFHSRFSIKKKTYLYRIINANKTTAFLANRVSYIKKKLNIQKMEEASSLLIGKHNFRGLCSSNTSATDFVREIFDIKILKNEDEIDIEVCGSGFLYNMVRIIVGTMVDYSLGLISKQDVLSALNDGDRTKAGRTMPACGLYLKETFY